jgi:23S rRNA (guanine745-N1)-methyltransferase
VRSGIVAPPVSRPGHRLLWCPICRLDLAVGGDALVCANRHSFDLARGGHVNLLFGDRRRPAAGGDTAEQLRHRAALLEAGHFDLFGEAIVRHLYAGGIPGEGRWRILDAGSGTGHHLARIADMLPTPAIGLGLDISTAAARHAARRWPGLAFAVADLWREWPVKGNAVDLVLSIFAPKNFRETARVLRPGAWLALVCPGPEHLIELDRHFRLLRRGEQKDERYAEAISRSIGRPTIVRHRRTAVLDGAAVRSLVLMGPNARHLSPAALEPTPDFLAVTIDIVILLARNIGSGG